MLNHITPVHLSRSASLQSMTEPSPCFTTAIQGYLDGFQIGGNYRQFPGKHPDELLCSYMSAAPRNVRMIGAAGSQDTQF